MIFGDFDSDDLENRILNLKNLFFLLKILKDHWNITFVFISLSNISTPFETQKDISTNISGSYLRLCKLLSVQKHVFHYCR